MEPNQIHTLDGEDTTSMGQKPDSFAVDDWRHGYASNEEMLKDLALDAHRDRTSFEHHLPELLSNGQAAWDAISAYAEHGERKLPDWIIDYLFEVAPRIARRRREGGDNRTDLRADLHLAGRDRTLAAQRALNCYYRIEQWCQRYPQQSRQRAANRYARYILKDRNMTPEAVLSLYKRGKTIDEML